MKKMLFTYKTIPNNTVEILWNIFDKNVRTGSEIKAWKKNDNIPVQVDIYMPLKPIIDSIDIHTEIGIFINYHSLSKSGGTSLQNNVYYSKLTIDENEKSIDRSFDCEIPGDKVAGILELTFLICLESSSTIGTSIFATEKGSILYEETISVYLEGNQALFPVKAIDFTKEEHSFPNSLYYLNKKFSELDSNFSSSYTLFFNTKHPLFHIINDDSISDSSNRYILKLIMLDVYRSILSDALDENKGIDENVPPIDNDIYSLNAVYWRITEQILRYFPGKSLDNLRQMHTGDDKSKNEIFKALQDFILND